MRLFPFNELPLKYLLMCLDDATSGSTMFSWILSKPHAQCHMYRVVNLKARLNLPGDLKNTNALYINKNKTYLFHFLKQ